MLDTGTYHVGTVLVSLLDSRELSMSARRSLCGRVHPQRLTRLMAVVCAH